MATFKNSVSGTDHAIVGAAEKGIGIHGTRQQPAGSRRQQRERNRCLQAA